MAEQMTGAEMVIQALVDQGVEHIFGYPGGAVLPIYDAMFQQDKVQHILVRHEQGATHMAEGYARSTGKVGVVLVTSGPGATNAVTGLTDALMDSIPMVCITGAGADAADRLGRVPGMRHGRHHAQLHQAQLSREADRGSGAGAARGVLHRDSGRPGPVLVDIPKDVQFAMGTYYRPDERDDCATRAITPQREGDRDAIEAAVEMMLQGRAADLLYRRRRDQLGPGGERAAARAGGAHGLSGDLDADGARRVPGVQSAVDGHARACTAPTKPTWRCTTAT